MYVVKRLCIVCIYVKEIYIIKLLEKLKETSLMFTYRSSIINHLRRAFSPARCCLNDRPFS